jgi:beta-lactamase class D
VETSDDVWFFACNIDMKNNEYGKLRKEMTFYALKAAGAI